MRARVRVACEDGVCRCEDGGRVLRRVWRTHCHATPVRTLGCWGSEDVQVMWSTGRAIDVLDTRVGREPNVD